MKAVSHKRGVPAYSSKYYISGRGNRGGTSISCIILQQWVNFCLSSIEGLVVHLLYGVEITVISVSISIHSGSQGSILGKIIRNLL